MESQVEQICSEVLCRKTQVQTLLSLFGRREDASCACVFVYGHSGTGKSLVIQRILNTLQLPHVVVNCVECFSSRLICEHILTKLQDDEQNPVTPRCDNMTDFLRNLRHMIIAQDWQNETFYIVLDKAERLRDMDANILPAFLRLPELAKMNITVIMLSEIVWEKFQFGTGFREPVLVHFSDYSKVELLQIMMQDCPEEHPQEFYSAYCQLLLSVFYAVCRDLNELRHLALLHFTKYCEPIKKGDATFSDSRKLWRNIEPHLKKALHTVYLREVSSGQWEDMICQDTHADSGAAQLQGSRSHVELPFYSKYLLLAAYLASYNPANTDRRFFTKQGQRNMSKKAKLAAKADRSNTQLTGPKGFPLDRLMAIFYSIVEDRVAPSASILSQISSLVSLNLLARINADDQIGSPKYKCLVNFEFIQGIAKQLEFDIVQYLYNNCS